MKKKDYLNSNTVKNFIDWIDYRLDKPNSFIHSYEMKKPNIIYRFTSIYSAYESYCWPFSYTDPISGRRITGRSFNDSFRSLNSLSNGLIESIRNSDVELCKSYCYSILDWGGVLNYNNRKIDSLGDGICKYFEYVIDRFNDDMSSEEYHEHNILMNSGFTKIYALCANEFIIYDGRVGAALGLLVRKFCEQNQLETVPAELSFAWGKGKESRYVSSAKNKRNPGNEIYKFPELLNNPNRHLENNIRANWLLCEIIDSTKSKFNELDSNARLIALESALFMIGYEVRNL